MPPITELKIREIIREELGNFNRSDRYTFEKLIQILDGRNIQLATGTGTKIGTAIGQKLSVYGVTPIVQRSDSAQAVVSGTADATYSANEVTLINDIVVLLNELRTSLINFGIIKGSA